MLLDGEKEVDLIRVKMDLDRLRASVNQTIDAMLQQIDSVLPEAPDPADAYDWQSDIKNW